MDALFGLQQGAPTAAPRASTGRGVFSGSFPSRVAALLRSRPIADLASSVHRHDWPADTYDLATLALAAIDLVIAQQGFEDEATYDEVLDDLAALAGRAAPDRPVGEHRSVARWTVDALLNRSHREAPFTYRISDYAGGEQAGHQQRQVQFRLLVEREDPARGDVVLNATGDAINALVGGLEFEVEDEQVANEILLERQLERGAFDAAERAAVRARLLSVSLADGLQSVLKQTRRDLASVLGDWTGDVPAALDRARGHILQRVEVEHRLLAKVRETVVSDDAGISSASARIAALLDESRRRHDLLHEHVMDARAVFLDEQDRQSFRPPAIGYLPDLPAEVFHPMLALPTATAVALADRWVTDVSGPRPPRLPRLYRVINDLWTAPPGPLEDVLAEPEDDVAEQETPLISPDAVAAASRAVAEVGLPARLSALIAACLADGESEPENRRQAAEITALAALWCFSPEDPADPAGQSDQPGQPGQPGQTTRADLATAVLGARAAVDADDLELSLPGWSGDDLIVAPYGDALANADPAPVTELPVLEDAR